MFPVGSALPLLPLQIPLSKSRKSCLLDGENSVKPSVSLGWLRHRVQSPRGGNSMDLPAQAPTLISSLVREMRLRGYSHRTIKAYTSYLRAFIRYHAPRHPRTLSDEDIRAYIDHLITIDRFEGSTIHQVLNTLRFLYVELFKRPMVLGNIPRPKKERKLPVVLSLEAQQRKNSLLH